MNSSNFRLAALLVGAAMASVLTSCKQPSEAAPATSSDSTTARTLSATAATSTTGQAASTNSAVEAVLGNYVDPTTMAVGGAGAEFQADDRLFAAVSFPPSVAGTPVLFRIEDANGRERLTRQAAVTDISQSVINLDLDTATGAGLSPGRYTLEVTVGKRPATIRQFTVL